MDFGNKLDLFCINYARGAVTSWIYFVLIMQGVIIIYLFALSIWICKNRSFEHELLLQVNEIDQPSVTHTHTSTNGVHMRMCEFASV